MKEECYPGLPKEKSTQIENECQMLSNAVIEIETQHEDFYKRLHDILIPHSPKPTNPGTESCEEELVPLADRIRSLRQRLQRVIFENNELMQRIEL